MSNPPPGWIGGSAKRRQRVAERLSREDQLAFAVVQAAVIRFDGLQLRRREARLGSGGARRAGELLEVKRACARVGEKTLFQRVARLEDGLRHHLRGRGRNLAFGMPRQLDAARHAGRVHLDMAIRQRAGDDAVEILRIALRVHGALASACRAPFVVRVLLRPAVELLDDRLGRGGHLVHGVREVHDLSAAEGKHSVRAIHLS